MRPRRRFILWLFGVTLLSLVMLVGIVFGLGRWWLRGSLPQTTGTITVDGISAPVRIVRDAYGVPTIHGASIPDAYYGLGYVHAQDRFFQMEMQRRTGQGRLSEIAGASMVETDSYMRKLGIYKLAEADFAGLPKGTRDILEAYARGVNAWLVAHHDHLPPELGLLRVSGVELEPEPWRPADSLVWTKVMAVLLSGNAESELLDAELLAKFGAERAAQLDEQYPANGPVTVATPAPAPEAPPPSTPVPEPHGARPAHSDGDHAALFELLRSYRLSSIGSNAWVIGPSRSVSGHPLLSNDTHLPIQNPSIFYLARLDAPGLQIVGATLPSLPGVIFGRNERIAWGMTNLGPDTQDLFVEKLDPKDPTHYLAGRDSLPLTVRREEIRVAGKTDPVVVMVRSTRHGPIIHDDWQGHGPVALRWSALDPGDTSIDAFLGMDQASSWIEYRAAVAKLVSPAQNFVYADVDGHIGYSASGKIPIRKQGRGLVPGNGWDDAWEWTGYVPFEELPQAFDPPEGYIVTANNKVEATDTPFFTTSWDPYRAARIRALILAKPKLGLDDLQVMRGDLKSSLADELLPTLLAATPKSARDVQALAVLKAWDRVETPDSAAGAIFTAYYAHLLPALVKDELGPELYAQFEGNRPDLMHRALTDPTGAWCDDVTTPTHETCGDAALHALHDAVEDLTHRLGADMHGWRRDRLGIAKFANLVGSQAPLIGGLFTRTVPLGGDAKTVHVNAFSFKKPYDTVMCPATIGEYELAPTGETRMALPLGQSGHPLSPHYDQYLSRWQRGEAVAMPRADGMGDELALQPR